MHVGSRSYLLASLLLASGFCGISYEVLYGRLLGNAFGDQFAVNAALLLTFLFGIGIGTRLAHRLWRWLWLIEAATGAFGVALAFASPVLDATTPVLGRGQAGVVIVAVLVLCGPAFLIGCSVPLFAGYLERLRGGRPFARVYAIYNLGAAATALVIEFVLVRALGLRGAMCAIAALNAVVATGLYAAFADMRAQPPPAAERTRFSRRDLAALALASVASAIVQLTLLKIAESLFGPFRETFALVLALVLLGIAIGSIVVDKLRMGLAPVLAIAWLGLIWTIAGLDRIAHSYAHYYPVVVDGHLSAALIKITALAALMGVPAIAFGATVPALLRDQAQLARDSGQLLFMSSLANAVGFLLVIVVVHRALDYGDGLAATALLVLAALALQLSRARIAWRLVPPVLVVVTFAALRFGWNENLLFFGHTAFHSDEDIWDAEDSWNYAHTFKGYQDTFSITWIHGRPHFFINGFVSIGLESPSEKLVGAFASSFAPRRDRALVLGVGSGATAGTVARLFDHMDGVEINAVVLDHLDVMAKYNFDLPARANATLVHDDAIHYVKVGDQRYSLIVNTVTTPLYFSSSKLYTHDFFELVKRRLAPDGVYMTWFDSRVGDRGADIILTTLGASFRECGLGAIKSTYYLLVCSDAPLVVHDRELVAREPVLAGYFRGEGIDPEAIAYGLVTTRALALVGAPAELNTLDRPTLEFEIASLAGRGIPAFKARLVDHIDPMELATRMSDWDPVAAAHYLHELVGSALARRYVELVRARVPEFEVRYRQREDAYARMRAAAAPPPSQ